MARRNRNLAKLSNALFYQRVLDLANATNQGELEEIVTIAHRDEKGRLHPLPIVDMRIGGRPHADVRDRPKALREVQECVRRALERCLAGADDPLRDPKRRREIDFVVRGRRPFEDVPAHVNTRGERCTFSHDLQDHWFGLTVELVVALKNNDVPEPWMKRRNWRVVPLKQCEVRWNVPLTRRRHRSDPEEFVCKRFYFPTRSDQRTCRRPACVQRDDYLHRPPRRRVPDCKVPTRRVRS